MALARTTQIRDENFGSYVNISPATEKLIDTLSAIDSAIAGSSGPWLESGGKVRLVTTTNEIELPNGTSAIPVVAFTSDPSTGIYRQALGEFCITASGTPILGVNGTDVGMRLYAGGLTTNYNLYIAQSNSLMNIHGSHTSTSELVIGRVATASQTAHSACRVRAGGAIASGRTNSSAVDLNIEVGQATGSGGDADVNILTYGGGGASGTLIRASESHTTFQGSTGNIINYGSSTSISSIWRADTSTTSNFFTGHTSTSEFTFGRLATATKTAHSVVTLKAGGAIASGRLDSNAVDLRIEIGQATGSGSSADIRLFTYAGGGASGTAIKASAEHTKFEGSTGYIVNYNVLSTLSSNMWGVPSATGLNFFSGDTSTSTFYLGRIGVAAQAPQPNVIIRAAGVISNGERTDQGAVNLTLEVGTGTGAASAADIILKTFKGDTSSATTVRPSTQHTVFEGSTGHILNYNVDSLSDNNRWNVPNTTGVNIYSGDTTSTVFYISRIGDSAATPHINATLRPGGVISNGERTDQDAINLILSVGTGTGASSSADVIIRTFAGGLGTGNTVRAATLHSTFEGSTNDILIGAENRIHHNLDTSSFQVSGNSVPTSNLLIGYEGTSTVAPSSTVRIKPAGMLASSVRADQDATSLRVEVGQATGAGAAANITFYTYAGGGISNSTLRTNSVHTTMYGSGTLIVSGDTSLSFTSLSGNLIGLKQVVTAPTASPASHGGLFIEGNDLKYIAPDNTISSLSGAWNRSGSTVSLANASDFVYLNGTGSALGIGISSAPTGGTGGSNSITIADKAADFTAGVAGSLSLFVNGTDLKSIDPSNAVRTYLTNASGCIKETGSYTGDGSDPKTVTLVNSNLIPTAVIVYGAPGSASPVDEDSAVVALKFGSTMSVLIDDLSGSPESKMEASAISSVTTGSFDVGDRLNISSTGYFYLVIGNE